MTYVVHVKELNLARVQRDVKYLGYRPIGRIIMRRVLNILINDIKQGRVRWPVDSGYSIRNFYTDGMRLLNYASYAPAIESGKRANGKIAKRKGFITLYWRQWRLRIINLALKSLGWPKRGEPFRNFAYDVQTAHNQFLTRSRRASVRRYGGRRTDFLGEIFTPRGFIDPSPLLVRRRRKIEEEGLRIISNAKETKRDRARAFRNYYRILSRLFN